MTDERLAELERLAGEATPGPWVVAWNGDGKVSGVTPALDAVHDGEVFFAKNLERDGLARDCAYIVAACNAVPELLAEIKRLREYEAFVVEMVRLAGMHNEPPRPCERCRMKIVFGAWCNCCFQVRDTWQGWQARTTPSE